MSSQLENDLLKAADELEKTAADMECSHENKVDYPQGEKILDDEEKKMLKEQDTTPEKQEESTPTDQAKDVAKQPDQAATPATQDSPSAEKVAEIKEELGISEELAEKVASADPSVVELIKNMNQTPVESMGDEDTREKTASADDESDPFEEFLMTPL